MVPASHQVSATSPKLLIQQTHPHVRVERGSGMCVVQQTYPHVRVEHGSGMCVARDLYELWGRSPYTRMFVARTSH